MCSFPSADSLRYNEHLFGVSLFTLPWTAAGAAPVLAYNVTWWLTWVLNGMATFMLLRRHVAEGVAAFAGSLAFTCSFYVMLACAWAPASDLALAAALVDASHRAVVR